MSELAMPKLVEELKGVVVCADYIPFVVKCDTW